MCWYMYKKCDVDMYVFCKLISSEHWWWISRARGTALQVSSCSINHCSSKPFAQLCCLKDTPCTTAVTTMLINAARRFESHTWSEYITAPLPTIRTVRVCLLHESPFARQVCMPVMGSSAVHSKALFNLLRGLYYIDTSLSMSGC